MAERRAVVIGINSYDDDGVRPMLRGAENDAREMFARLKKFGDFNVNRDKHLLLGKDATCENIRRAISDLFWKKDPCDIAVLYFSGHGFLDDYGNGYIAPWDHIYADPLVRGIRMQELREYFLAKNNKTEALLILDCCHSGVTAEVQKGAVTDMPGRFYDSLTSDQAKVLGSGKFILASSGASEKSREMKCRHKVRSLEKNADELEFDDLEDHEHGVMTYFLLEGMSGDAAIDGNEVRIGSLYDYVRGEVNAYSQKNHNNSKVFDCVCSTYEEGPASQTMLVRASAQNELKKFIEDAQSCLEDMTSELVVVPASLFEGIRLADSALHLSPHDIEAKSLTALIDQKLAEYQAPLDGWKIDLKARRFQRPPFGRVYRPLEEMGDLTFDKIQKLDTQTGNALMYMIRLALGDNVESSFENLLKKLSQGKPDVRDNSLSAVPSAIGSSRHVQ